jgi:mRNA interferase MazF
VAKARQIRRGDIFYIENDSERQTCGSEQRFARPGIVVSNDACNKFSPTIEAVFLTAKDKKPLPTHVPIASALHPSIALCEQITTVAKTRLGKWCGRLTDSEIKAVDKALAISIGLLVS